MGIEVVELTADATGPLFDGMVDLHRAVIAEYDPAIGYDTPEFVRGTMVSNDTFRLKHLIAVDDGLVVGYSAMMLFELEGNTDKADTDIQVHPDHRRRGAGKALLAATLDVMEAEGRTSLLPASIKGPGNTAFWERMGAPLGLVERESRLWLADTEPDLMRSWVERRAERAPGYELVHWRGRTPTEHLEPVRALTEAMNDAPLDDLDFEDDVWTIDDLVAHDEWQLARGRLPWVSIVLSPDGEPAGMTVVRIQTHRPRFAGQGDTIVMEAHRNRGIGRWLKGDMWLRIRTDAPKVEAIDTGNAESNDPMLGINVAMGFKPLAQWGVWQASVADLRRALTGS